jgi:hypothetical protein
VCCSSVDNLTDEDVIPKWLLRAFEVQRASTVVTVGEEYRGKRKVRDLNHFQVTLDDGLCKRCNNELLSSLENVVIELAIHAAAGSDTDGFVRFSGRGGSAARIAFA